ncbi:uncharacterized protein LOC110705836 [Chenopodium quinoa]|uniref:uncharacterized protein LOC110705836 n=1 Tax=Chenopodium quinoa TaxID=63459 RepID=UPI000B78EF72|nr:uncharacterized protein LOC110705836 [Chenopodium quinoa]
MTPPLLSKPKLNETLELYLAVSVVLAREDQGQQLPIYYISKSLLDAETGYSSVEKLILALYTTVKKLRHYFEAHPVVVRTNFPIKSVLHRPELTGRLGKWSIYLSTYNITYRPRTGIKSQALADFVAAFSPELETSACKELDEINNVIKQAIWTMFCDGSSNQRGAGLGVVLKSPQGELIVQSISCDFKATNNEADYEALITGKKIEQDLQDIGLNVFSDSLLIASQLNGEFAAKDSKMIAYLEKAKTLAKTFNPFTIKQIPRDKNTQANALANLGSALRKSPFSSIPLVHLTAPSIDAASTPDIMEITTEDNWTMPILKYLRDDALPDDPLEARKIRYKASRYTILHNVLFKMSSTGLLQRCLVGDEQWEALQEHHDGDCGSHAGARGLATKLLRMGYFWQTLRKDAEKYIAKCDSCQRHT